MTTRYTHTNIVARDPERLAQFYSDVLDCQRSAERQLTEEWLGRGMGLPGTTLKVIHVRLPGTGEGEAGPTIEIFRMPDLKDGERSVQDRPGLMHMAFEVDDIDERLARLLAAGGETLGEIVSATVEGVGDVRFVYARDPEGNIVELQELGS
jgi:glyoxylase I family protein